MASYSVILLVTTQAAGIRFSYEWRKPGDLLRAGSIAAANRDVFDI
jgi:hypothetical protein